MDTLIIIILAILILSFALLTGWVASRIGKSFHFWFLISIGMPVIGLCILLCIPEESPTVALGEKGELFHQIYPEEDITKILN